MTVAKNPRDLPIPVLVLPYDDELRDAFALTRTDLAEAMLALFDRAKVFDRIDLQRLREQFAMDFIADIFARVRDDSVTIKGRATGIVIELYGRRKVAAEDVEIAAVVSIEDLRIERSDRSCEGGTVIRRWGLSQRRLKQQKAKR